VGKKAPLENFSSPLEKRVEQNLKLLDIVQIILTPLRKLIAPLGVPSWLVVTSQKETCVEVLLPKKRIFGTIVQTRGGRTCSMEESFAETKNTAEPQNQFVVSIQVL